MNAMTTSTVVENGTIPRRREDMSDDNQEEDMLSAINSKDNKNAEKILIVWKNVAIFATLHMASLYGLRCLFIAKPATLFWGWFYICFAAIGITAGVHRLWSHRSYRAKTPFRILLALMNSAALQNSIYDWVRDHRVHHKYSETNADPHNAKRGFFFAHIGWLLVRKHPDVLNKGRQISLLDLVEDKVVMFQKKYYKSSVITMCFLVPMLVPWILWGESIINSFFVCSILRYTLNLHATWLVNSAAHMWGNKPYDKTINPSENKLVVFLAFGEGFHNYHHTFPFDYSTSEFGFGYNVTTMFIDFFAFIGQVTDRKKMSKEMILNRRKRTGDMYKQ